VTFLEFSSILRITADSGSSSFTTYLVPAANGGRRICQTHTGQTIRQAAYRGDYELGKGHFAGPPWA